MDDVTREALEQSIEKWEKNLGAATWREVTTGARDCPLCGLFNSVTNQHDPCVGCPVRERTESQFCWDTPHQRVAGARPITNSELGVSDYARSLIQEEVDFLKSLRVPS